MHVCRSNAAAAFKHARQQPSIKELKPHAANLCEIIQSTTRQLPTLESVLQTAGCSVRPMNSSLNDMFPGIDNCFKQTSCK